MLKFSKYFFVLFFAVTVIPLTFMFFWNHHELNTFAKKREAMFLDNAIKQMDNFTKEYLNNRKDFIVRTVTDLSASNISIKQYKSIFDADNIYLLTKSSGFKGDYPIPSIISYLKTKNFSHSTAYFDIIKRKNNKPALVSVVVVPFNANNYKALVVIDYVSINEFYHHGPFDLELYAGTKIKNNSLIAVRKDLFMQHHKGFMPPTRGIPFENMKGGAPMPPRDGFMPPPREGFIPPQFDKTSRMGREPGFMPMHDAPKPPAIFVFESKIMNYFQNNNLQNGSFKTIPLKNNLNKPVATILLRSRFSHGMMPINIEEQELGLVILLTGALLSFIIGFYMKQNFINPIILLAAASERVKNGDLSFKIASKVRHPETKETIKVFNDMIDGLLERNELRNNFVTNLTHDLRTPLLAQERAIELIINEFEALQLVEQAKLAKGLDHNNKHLLRMVNLILEAYRFDSCKVKVTPSAINIFELASLCCTQLEPLAAEKNIKLINNIASDFGTVYTDRDSLKRIFLNLISNAIDNIPMNCEVKIIAQRNNENIEIFVADNGTGISSKDIDYIFDRFYTGKSDERKIGSGLGLYVCKKLAELNGGKIFVESEVGKYTKFSIILPAQSKN